MFRTIIITLPEFLEGEADRICGFLESGTADLVHIRKPGATAKQTESLIRAIPEKWYDHLVLHDHHELAKRYHLHGIHLNSRNPDPLEGWRGSVSRSCHQIEELKRWKDTCSYLSLSPIYDSISKSGYKAAFSCEDIQRAVKDGIIDEKVYALGGVTFDRLEEVRNFGFGGAMILGDAWRQ